MIVEPLVLEALRLLQQNKPAYEVQSRCSQAAYAEAVKRLKDKPSVFDLTTAAFAAKQAAEKRAYYQHRATNGQKAHKASQQDHNNIVGCIFASVDAGHKPTMPIILRAYGEEQNRPPEWAERVATQKRPKRMGKTITAYSEHAVIQDLREGRMFTQTHRSTLQNSTYSGLAELLFSGSQSTREKRAMKERIATLEARVSATEAETARAHARIDASEQWKTDAVDLYRVGKSYGFIALQTGKGKTTVHEHIQALISAEELEARPPRQKS
jgi:hypothetical protein